MSRYVLIQDGQPIGFVDATILPGKQQMSVITYLGGGHDIVPGRREPDQAVLELELDCYMKFKRNGSHEILDPGSGEKRQFQWTVIREMQVSGFLL
jgi:hypothetical protein